MLLYIVRRACARARVSFDNSTDVSRSPSVHLRAVACSDVGARDAFVGTGWRKSSRHCIILRRLAASNAHLFECKASGHGTFRVTRVVYILKLSYCRYRLWCDTRVTHVVQVVLLPVKCV